MNHRTVNNNIKISAISPRYGCSGKSFLADHLLTHLRDKKMGTVIITDPIGVLSPTPFVQKYTDLPDDERKAFLASNNWRRMHGYPLRRGTANRYFKENESDRKLLRAMGDYHIIRISDPPAAVNIFDCLFDTKEEPNEHA